MDSKKKECDHEWHFVTNEAEGLQRCVHCVHSRYRPFGKSYTDALAESSNSVVEAINADPLHKKLFNFIKNDLSGILNGVRDERITFEYNDLFVDKTFLDQLLSILKTANFKEQRYDKKYLKETLTILFSEMSSNESFIPGKRQPSLTLLFPLNDRELTFLVYLTHRL